MAKWNEIRKYLFREFPEGWFFQREKVDERAASMSAFLVALTFLMFVWFTVNAPVETVEIAGKKVVKAGGMKWRWLGIVYATMGSFSIALTGIEWIGSKKLRPLAVPMPGGGDWGMLKCVATGIVIGGVIFALSLPFATMKAPFTLTIFPESPLINWAIVGFSIPIIEEAFFSGIIGASFTENYGLSIGLMVPSTIFGIFHWGIYGLSTPLFISLFLFRSLSTLSMVFSRSWIPGLTAHIFINTASICIF